MTGRGGRSHGARGAGRGGQRNRQGKGQGYKGNVAQRQFGLCKELATNVFDYGTRGAADQMRNSWEKLCQYVGAEMGEDIANELRNETVVVIPIPTYADEVLQRHQTTEQAVINGRANLQTARRAKLNALLAMPAADQDPVEIANLQNEITIADLQVNQPVPVDMYPDEKTQYDNEWRAYRHRKDRLEKNRGQAYSLVLGQCTKLLQDQMKNDPDWQTVKTSNDPLQLYRLIKKVIQGQTEDQYPCAQVYDQLVGLLGFHQETSTNAQWYDKFNTRVDVATSIGAEFDYHTVIEYQAGKDHPTVPYDNLTDDQKNAVKEAAEERFLAYVMLRQSGKQHTDLKLDLKNEFTTGDDKYPTTRQQVLHLLDHYSKKPGPKTIQSEGSSNCSI